MRRRSPGVRLTAALLLTSLPALARDLPNYHSVYSGTPRAASSSTLKAMSARVPRTSAVKSGEARFALPTIIRAPYSPQGALPSARTPADAAREHLRVNAGAYFLRSGDTDLLTVKHIHDTGRGAIIVNFVSRPGGLEVWGEQLNVVMDRKLRLVGLTGYVSTPESAAALFSGTVSSARQPTARFQIDHSAAVAAAYGDLTGSPLGGGAFAENGMIRGDYRGVELRGGVSTPSPLRFPARAKQVLFHQPGSLEPAYYVEVGARDPETRSLDYYAYVISGRDGRVLVRRNLSASAQAFTYRVWADTTGIHQPWDSPYGTAVSPAPETGPTIPFVAPPSLAAQDVTLVSGPISTGDPWLADDATETVGNNVDAYADLGGEDGYFEADPGTDYRAQTTGAAGTHAFQYAWDPNQAAGADVTSNKAAIVHLFYLNNWFHDWYYDSGFDEASGNAQKDNYGRGPSGGDQDPLFAEAFDFSGTNNANMWTPADGASPRMQMYIFDGQSIPTLHVNGTDLGFPGGNVPVTTLSDSPANYDLTKDVVQAAPAIACTPITNTAAVTGKIVLIDRGTCTFAAKATAALTAGAVGVIFRNATNGATNVTQGGINIPSFMVTGADGNTLIAAANGAGLNVHMKRETKPQLDGAIDSGIVAHEWGHFIQHRLIAAGNQDLCASCQGAGMGEGWSDFHALLMLVREEDKNVAGNDHWQGAYGAGAYATAGLISDPIWFGIRRVTYSTDFAKNGTTFKFIAQAFAPGALTFPWGGSAGDNPTEVHNTGEIWASMLWDCYAALLNAHPFAEAQQLMKDYLVAAYKVTPAFPTFVEARDALLQVAAAGSAADYDLFGAAFARRGLGVAAVAPDRADGAHSGLVEDFTWGTNVRLESVVVGDGPTNCDGDGILDNGEVGLVSVTLRNVGKDTVTGVTGTVASSDTGVTFPDGPNLTFPSIAPGATGVATAKITVTGLTAPAGLTVTATVQGASLKTSPQNGDNGGPVPMNLDDVASAATDDFEAFDTNWTVAYGPHSQSSPGPQTGSFFRSSLDNGTNGWAAFN
ncbi:MAG TPA: M36 family metallopeptidase, partial [Myxococcaceae bacterium]